MDQKEWRRLRDTNKNFLDFTYYNKCRKLQKELIHNPDPNAKVIHHLRDTEEQRNYNDEHYEFWGFNQDGTFEYGKYVIFVTKEEHTNIHSHSDETKKKMSDSRKGENCYWYGKHRDAATKEKISNACKGKWAGKNNPFYGKQHSDETKNKISESKIKFYENNPNFSSGENNPMYGKHHTEEAKHKISEASKNKVLSDETKEKISNANKGKVRSDETKKKLSKALKDRYANMTDEEKEVRNAAWKKWYASLSDEDKEKLLGNRKGKSLSDEHKQHISAGLKGRVLSDETKAKISASNKGKQQPPLSESARKIISKKSKEHLATVKELYLLHKQSGGTLKWNEFQKQVKLLYPEQFK